MPSYPSIEIDHPCRQSSAVLPTRRTLGAWWQMGSFLIPPQFQPIISYYGGTGASLNNPSPCHLQTTALLRTLGKAVLNAGIRAGSSQPSGHVGGRRT